METPAQSSSEGTAEKSQLSKVSQILDSNSNITKEKSMNDLSATQPINPTAAMASLAPEENVKSEPMDSSQDTEYLPKAMDTAMDVSSSFAAEDLSVSISRHSPAFLNLPSQSVIVSAGNMELSGTSQPPISSTSSMVIELPTAQSKPKSMFSSLFPTPKSRTPTPPSVLAPTNLTVSKANLKKETDQNTEISAAEESSVLVENPQVMSTTIENLLSTPAESMEVTSDISKTFTQPTETISHGANIATIQNVAKIVDSDTIAEGVRPIKTDSTSPRSRLRSSPPNIADPIAKVEAKQLPIAGKTIKRERSRKASSSSASPTIPGTESKKLQKSKSSSTSPGAKTKKKRPPAKEDGHDGRNDFYCWICHKEGEVLCCELCPRVFHAKCLNMTVEPEGDWFCPECEKITEAECKETQSRAMSMLSIDQFSLLLKYVIQRMKLPMSEPFHEPVDTKMFLDYVDYVFHPMDLSTIEKYVKKRKYGCPEAFVIDFKWVIHNCIIYNSPQSKLTQTAKSMLKVAERELNEIEICPECYLNSCRKRENWFCEPCKELHPLVWAKLQGFPHWPAKALRIDKGLVDVRFFGQHDRAWIPLSGCYLISKELPLPIKNRKKSKDKGIRGGLDGAMQEMQSYIENVKKITGEFEYAPPRTLLTHCDLYRRTAKTILSGKHVLDTDVKEIGQGTSSRIDSSAKIELKDVGGTKELMKSRATGPTTPKKTKTMTTSGEHPARAFGTKKKKASMEFLNKTIESCKASLGIEKIQDVRMNSGSDDSTSSSEDEDNPTEDAKVEDNGKDIPSTSTSKPTDEDDSDAELVIDLGDMEDTTAADVDSKTNNSALKTSDTLLKKRKPEDGPDKQSTPKPALKSILLNTPKPIDKDERKKMLAKALSEKIATGKRKHGVEDSPVGSSPSTKVRRTHDPHERRSRSPVGKFGMKEKDKKKSHISGKYIEKDTSGKVKSGILKSSSEISGQRKEGHPSDKRPTDPSIQKKHKEIREGAQKSSSSKKNLPPDKLGRADKIPTGADVKKLFNGGRIPRKNPVSSSMSDEEQGDKVDETQVNMEINPITEIRRRSADRPASNPQSNGTRHGNLARQTSTEPSRRDENMTMINLKKYSDKVMDTVQKVFYEMYTDMMVPLRANAGPESNAATATAMHEVAQMRLELERLKWMHEQEIAELKHNHDLTVAEIRQSLEYEKKQLLLDAKDQAEAAKICAIDETKRKQWCAFCNKEAIFYCCWNTSYCDYPCQQKHWHQHMNSCTQARESGAQPTAMETMTSASSSVSILSSSSTPSQLNVATSILSSKPAITSVSPGKSTITISDSPGDIRRLTTCGKSATTIPATVRKQVATSISKQPAKSGLVIMSATNPIKSQKSQTSKTEIIEKISQSNSSQQKGGSSISAIGARLLAAKEQSNIEKSPNVTKPLASPTPQKDDHFSTSDSNETMLDHVKTTLESPMSPDAKLHSTLESPMSPDAKVHSILESPMSPDAKVDSTFESLMSPDSPKDASSPLVFSNINTEIYERPVEKFSQLVTSSGPANRVQPTISESQVNVPKSQPTSKIAVPELSNLPKPAEKSKMVSKPHPAIFSSPSAVASLIADMGTPLSSTLSSPESSSFSDTPEKTPDISKVQLSLAGSAFTKVVPDTSKVPVGVQSGMGKVGSLAGSFSTKPIAETAESTLTTFKPIDMKSSNEPDSTLAVKKTMVSVPVVAPVLADSYLSSLQKSLVKKIGTPPIPLITDPLISKTEVLSSTTRLGAKDVENIQAELKSETVIEPMEIDKS